MAYNLYYTAHFTNEQSQDVEINIYKDAAAPSEVENYEVVRCELTDNGEDQTKYACIKAREMVLTIETREGKSITWETFITAEHDDWKIEMLIDSQYYFQGFITPDEGNGPFQDKPYDVTIRATNGLALLKGVQLTDTSGDEFDGDNTLIDYIAGALSKTGLGINIRIYCGYFHASMLNKGDSLFTDMFQQAKLNYRTFMKDATTFVSCYDALKIILDRFCTLEYWKGMWVISNIAESQFIPGKRYYVDYSSSGSAIGGGVDTNNYGQIGKSVDIYPINETQQIYSRYAVKSVKTSYTYTPWPEIPRNAKFERGDFIDEGPQADEDDLDGDGDISEIIGTYKQYTIDDWEFGKVVAVAGSFPFVLSSPDGTARVKRIYNQFGVEIDRQIIIDTPLSNTHWLRSEAIPVTAGDRVQISLETKLRNDITTGGTAGNIPAYCYIVNDAGTEFWGLHTASPGGDIPEGIWRKGSLSQLAIFYAEDQDSRKYATLSLESMAIPVNGNLYVVLSNGGSVGFNGPEQIYRSFDFKYTPFVAGGYIQVKGDYWFRSQTANYPDVIDEEVFISDSRTRVLKGALLLNDQLTDPAWYRYGDHTIGDANPLAETRHFKELLNIGRFNHSYRRMYALEGDFNGLNWSPENDQLNKQPICFFWKYREVDMDSVRDFVFVTPLTMDIVKGWIKGNLVEVYNSFSDGTQTGTSEFKHIF